MKIKFEDNRIALDNGIMKVRYTIACVVMSCLFYALWIYIWRKYGFKKALLLGLASAGLEATAWLPYFLSVYNESDNWYVKAYLKVANWVGFDMVESDEQ